uniref:UNC93-like protein MFSD11 n=1 Tax=Acrobeloides nanus TaxID=290746 RepID=A0A914C0X8_9BILA
MSIGFFFMLFAAQSQNFVEETILNSYADKGKIPYHVGYISMAIMYGVSTASVLFVAPIIDILKRRALPIAGFGYALFLLSFFYLNEIFLFITSVIFGFSRSVLYAAMGFYLTSNSNPNNSSLVGGGILLFIIFHNSNSKDEIQDSTVKYIYGAFTGVTIFAIAILALLRKPLNDGKARQEKQSQAQRLSSTFRLFVSKKMLYISLPFTYIGITFAFWSGIYPTTIAQTNKFDYNTHSLTGISAIATGMGQVLAGLIFGFLNSKFTNIRRDFIVLFATILHLLVYVAIYINFPKDAPLKKTCETGIIEPK